MEAKLFFCFVVVLHLFAVAPFCYAGRSRLPVKSIKSPDGDIIDCVHISRQPAFNHPALKNHTIKWHSNGKCPKGTVPIIRTKKDDPLRANSVKKSSFVAQPSSVDYVHLGHELRPIDTFSSMQVPYTRGQFYGAKATLNVWNPKVQEGDEFSLAQLWILGGSDSDMNTIEAGWQSTSYDHDGCYNHDCPGFMQTNNEIALGGTISPTSQVDGSQYDITILIWKDPKEGDWWMQLGDGEVIGYWPASVFTHLSESASMIYWGGEIINNNTHGHHTSTQMGSGHFPEEGFRKASYVKNIQTVDETVTLRTPEDLTTYISGRSCYDVKKGINDDWGSYFFYGGPGRNHKCP
ncbi:hypothetical protein L1987_00980 [Smallanthus sonchifolius]|uniref:Uncharacterized protein n=1 Tax=Smallanthus sonchifolius TaxID=185202 RepID=A0ACB9K3M9_9ASTR|nr:hypothetical protein L1987_00980 [Smallanthus sonchifolius]